ncbi:MAG: prolyl oligopeptidase family serine peptidase, partial [Thermoanaerobaculia bacterium]
KWLGIVGSGASGTVASNEAALMALAPGAGPPPRRTRNLVLEDHVFWAGKQLFVSGMGEPSGRQFTATEPRVYRAEPGPGDGDLALTRIAPESPGSLSEIVSLADGTLLTDEYVSTRMRVSLVEPSSGKVRMLLDHRGWVANLSASRDGRRIAFAAGDPGHFAEIYVAEGLEDLASAKAVTDFNVRLSRSSLPEIESVDWDGGDGVRVEGVVDWPPGRKGEKGLPVIVDLHGGPFGVARSEALDLYGSYMSYPTLLAARGYLVLNVNYRGSGGRGDAFTRGIQDHFCSVPSQDVIRGVESLVARGWADPKRAGVIGYSGGGGLTKCLAGRTDIFRAIVTGAGVWDGVTLYGTGRGGFWADVFFGGKAPWEDFRHWWIESPVGAMATAKTPTLIVAGQKDGDGPAQATEMYHDFVWRGTPAELLLFPGETHIFAKPSHKKTKIRSEVEWFERYLRGT